MFPSKRELRVLVVDRWAWGANVKAIMVSRSKIIGASRVQASLALQRILACAERKSGSYRGQLPDRVR
jgi:hypothetical protein